MQKCFLTWEKIWQHQGGSSKVEILYKDFSVLVIELFKIKRYNKINLIDVFYIVFILNSKLLFLSNVLS